MWTSVVTDTLQHQYRATQVNEHNQQAAARQDQQAQPAVARQDQDQPAQTQQQKKKFSRYGSEIKPRKTLAM